MAEYYPLLARAVSAQPNATPETRNGIYERARKALLGQLRAHEPPVAEEDIERESRALDEAIARLEAEQSSATSRPEGSLKPDAHAPSASPNGAPEVAPGSTSDAVRKPLTIAPRPAPQRPVVAPAPILRRVGGAAPTSPQPHRTNIAESKAPEVRPNTPFEGSAAAPAIERGAGSAPEQGPAPAVAAAEKRTTPPAERSLPRSGILRKFGRPRVGVADTGTLVVPEPAASEKGSEPAAGAPAASVVANAEQAQPNSEPVAAPARPEPVRPTAPTAHVEKRRPILAWVLGALAAVLVAGIAVLAFTLRDNPQTLVAKKPVPVQEADKTPGKIVDRIGVGPTHLSRVPSPGALAEGAAAPPAAGAAVPAAQGPIPSPVVAPSTETPSANAPLPVAQRAALLVQAPTASDPQAIATYVGTVVWRLFTVNQGPDQPVALAVRAEVDVPDAKFKGSMLFERNADATLPASHTIELRFSSAPGSPIGDVRQIDTPQMRKEDSPAGDPLSGIPTPITPNYFLVGLTKGDPGEARNLDLIRTRSWMDVPMLLASGKIAKITFEKGVAGEKVLNDALASWTQ